MNYNILYKTQALAQDNTLLVSVIFLYIFAVFSFCALIANKFLAKPIMVIVIIATAAASYFIKEYGVIIDHNMIANAAKTDPRELKDLVNPYFFIYLFFTGLLPLALLFMLKVNYESFLKNTLKQVLCVIIGLAFVVGILLSHSKSILPFFRTNNNLRMYNVPFYQVYSFIKFIKLEFKKDKVLEKIGTDATQDVAAKDAKRILVVVVGETARAANYSALGYTKNETNFYTKGLGVRFYKATSCGTYTAKSLPCMFSVDTKATHDLENYKENALDVLRRAGVKVSWYGNNSGGCQGVCDRLKDKIVQSAEFDSVLIDELKANLKNPPKQELIVLHLQGSHGPSYYKRYPKAFRRFTPTCDTSKLNKCTHEEVVNTYDNSLLYTDFLLKEVINQLQKLSGYETQLLYLSDHGESLGENGVYLHGLPYFLAPIEQKTIPFMVWGPKHIKPKDSSKLSQDDLFSTILGYFDVKTKVYEKSLDVLE